MTIYLHPGVYLEEVSFAARSIDGVSTSTAGLVDAPTDSPRWTDHNEHDPGVTLVQMFAWAGDLTLYRIPEQRDEPKNNALIVSGRSACGDDDRN